MTRFLLLTLALTAVGCATLPAAKVAPVLAQRVAPAAPLSRRAMVKQILPHNVRVYVMEGKTARRSASGVVVGTEATSTGAVTFILTNAHVVDASGLIDPRLNVVVEQGPDTADYLGEPVAMGTVPQMDLALIRVPGLSLAAAPLASDEEVELGDDVVVVGAPFGKPLSISGGMVSQVEWDRSTRSPRMLKTDAPIGYGASGGGVYSLTTGKLLAIVEGYRTAKIGFAVAQQDYSFDVPMPGETFAAPTAKVREFLSTNGFGRFLGAPVGAAGPDSRAALR